MSELNFYLKLAKAIKPLGYRCFLYNRDGSLWMYIITPSNSWLYVDRNYYGSYEICYQYVPSSDFGSGCQCINNLNSVSIETLNEAESYGKRYSAKTWHYEYLTDSYGRSHRVRVCGTKRPKHYTNALEAMLNSWCAKYLEEIL